MKKHTLIIGLETHVELKTISKMFCQCSADYFSKPPNTNTCPVCLGLPGALPVPNQKAIEWTIKIAKAFHCTIPQHSHFDRKHYFYPDLPKGYQISQYDEPFGVKGSLTIVRPDGTEKTCGITRVHLEEDTGKLIHTQTNTLVDFNRSGVPLVEIVTEPDFGNSDDVKLFLEELHAMIIALDVSDADMEKGSMRMEPNISVSLKSTKELPDYKVEVKNINSFRYVKQAIEYEFERQSALLEKGEKPVQETRGFNEKKGETYSQRSKEEAHDYRYFPEPDIPPMVFEKEMINSITVPELPLEKAKRYHETKKIRPQDAYIIAHEALLSSFFEIIINEIDTKFVKEKKAVTDVTQKLANVLINKKLSTDIPPGEFIKRFFSITQPIKTDTKALETAVGIVLDQHQSAVADYKVGKQNAIMFLVGQVMKSMKGKANALAVKEMLVQKIEN